MVAVGIGETRRVQPIHGHSFAKMRRGQQLVYKKFVRVFIRIFEECIDLLKCRRQTNQIQVKSTDQRFAGSLRRWSQPRRFHACEDEIVNRISRPGHVRNSWKGWTRGGDKRPMLLELRPRSYPRNQLDSFVIRELLARVGRWHVLGRISALNATDKFARLRIARDDWNCT